MKTLSFSIKEKPAQNGLLSLAHWHLPELLDLADADNDARNAFITETTMLQAGGWQSWSPGWELAPGEQHYTLVRHFNSLFKLIAAPWECSRHKTKRRAELTGTFIIYLRVGSWYLTIAAGPDNSLPVVFSISKDRRLIRAAVYAPEGTTQETTDKAIELKIFLAQGYFPFKDQLQQIYKCEEIFSILQFLGKGKPGIDFRPGGYASWYNHYTKIDEKSILADLDGLLSTDNIINVRYLKKGQPAIFQIDDGWERAVGEWEIDKEKFPGELKHIAQKIEQAGMIPGLWLAPFLVTRHSRIFCEQKEWLLRDQLGLVKAGWNPNWDGTFYCLDLSREDVLAYLRSVMKNVIDEWGFRYLKLDFLYAGYYNTPDCYERAIALLTEQTKTSTGLPTAYLGCGVPLGVSYRHFPLSRIGADTRESWDWQLAKTINHEGRPSALLSMLDTIGRSYMNGTIFINDPDVVFLRSENCSLSENEKECIALINFLFAGQIMCSDNFHSLNESDFAFTKKINSLYDKLDGDEYGPVGLDKNVFLLESRSGNISGIINLSDKPYELESNKEYFLKGTWLVDHRLDNTAQNRHCFAPRSVSIFNHLGEIASGGAG